MERLSIPFLEINVPAVLLYEMQKFDNSRNVCIFY